jgi:hypothetical protein
MEYFYIKSPENHYDLADCFDGVFDTETQSWRFNITKKEDVLNFLHCSENEETDEEDITDYLNKYAEKKRPKRSRSVHRARSACVDKSSDLDSNLNSDSDSGLEKNNVNHKTTDKQQNEQTCEIAEKKQTTQQKKVQELKKLIK